MQICRRNCKPLIVMFSLIIASKARCAHFLPPGRASAAAVLPHSDLSSEIRVTQNKTQRRRGWLGAGSTRDSGVCGGCPGRGACTTDGVGAMIYREQSMNM